MPTLEELRQKRDDLLNKAESIHSSAEAESRDMTDEEYDQVDSLLSEIDQVDGQVERMRRSAEQRNRVQSAASTRPTPRSSSTTKHVSAGDARSATSLNHSQVHVEVGTPGWQDDPKYGFESPRDFLYAVMRNAVGDAEFREDSRLRLLSAAGSDEQGTYSDPYGGFLVPRGFMPEMLSVATEADPTMGRTREVSMDSPHVEIPARTDKNHTDSVTGGLQVYRRAEADTVSATRMETELVHLRATSLMGIAYATDEILTDSPMAFSSMIAAGFGDEFRAKIFREKLTGTGVGQMEGVINAAATIDVAKETGQAANTIVYENILNMRSRCWGYRESIWLANHDTMPELDSLNKPVGTGGSLVWHQSLMDDTPDMLMGRPIFFTEFCETLGTSGDIILANWREFLEGTYQPLRSAESIHVRFNQLESTFRFDMRNDGRWWWRAALTPAKSSTTLSPAITLATRA